MSIEKFLFVFFNEFWIHLGNRESTIESTITSPNWKLRASCNFFVLTQIPHDFAMGIGHFLILFKTVFIGNFTRAGDITVLFRTKSLIRGLPLTRVKPLFCVDSKWKCEAKFPNAPKGEFKIRIFVHESRRIQLELQLKLKFASVK